uniref:Uncharacterized protein n=1 Tax=Globodera rostochiensis TaxID=31243 RepID=A0A914GVD0_GLORO
MVAQRSPAKRSMCDRSMDRGTGPVEDEAHLRKSIPAGREQPFGQSLARRSAGTVISRKLEKKIKAFDHSEFWAIAENGGREFAQTVEIGGKQFKSANVVFEQRPNIFPNDFQTAASECGCSKAKIGLFGVEKWPMRWRNSTTR